MESLLLTLLPNDGFYKGAKLRFKICFPESYPEEVPHVQCLDKVYHPNIDPSNEVENDPDTSNVCVSLLDEWDPSMGLDHVVLALLFLLYNPNPEDALSPYFDECLDMEDLEHNIRQALRGETVEGQDWPRLLVEEEEGEGDASGVEKGTPADGESATQPETDNKRVADDEPQAQSRKEEGDAAHGPEELARSAEESDATEFKPPTPTESCLATVLALWTDSGTSVDGQDCDGQSVSLSEATVSADNDSSFSKMSLLDNHHNFALTDVVAPNFNTDFPLICLDAGAGRDCNKSSDIKSFADSLSIARLFSCTSCTCRASGSGIKALFSCFRQRDATVQFQTTNTGVLDALGDCDVD